MSIGAPELEQLNNGRSSSATLRAVNWSLVLNHTEWFARLWKLVFHFCMFSSLFVVSITNRHITVSQDVFVLGVNLSSQKISNFFHRRLCPCQVQLFVQRVINDYDNAPQPLRTAVTFRSGLSKHQACGAFLHFLKHLERVAPASEFPKMAEDLKKQFAFGYLDPDLIHSLESQVPPGDISQVAAFRTHCFSDDFHLYISYQ